MLLENRSAIVTGAGRGIGRAIALAYAREGARLALAARTAAELDEVAGEVQALGASALVISTDVADQDQVDRMVSQVVDAYSTVDVLVNNAGIGGPVGALQDNDPGYWSQTLQVNLVGTYLCCRAVLPVMLRQGGGRIINISGSGGATAASHISAYCVSKAAVVRFTECLALELEETGVYVNALGPGGIHTRLVEEMQEEAAASGSDEIYEQSRNVTSGGGRANGTCRRTSRIPGQRRCGKPQRPAGFNPRRPAIYAQPHPRDYSLRHLPPPAGGAALNTAPTPPTSRCSSTPRSPRPPPRTRRRPLSLRALRECRYRSGPPAPALRTAT